MSDTVSRNSDFEYPTQPISTRLIDRLYKEVSRLEAHPLSASLAADFGSRMVAAVLRRLDRDGYVLYPRSEAAHQELAAKALYQLRVRWHSVGKRDRQRARNKADVRLMSTLIGEDWQPYTSLYGADCTLHADSGRFPGEDLLGGETGRCLLEEFQRRTGLPRERALAIILACILPRFPQVREALEEMGYSHLRFAYLRKWVGEQSPHCRRQLREILREWGISRNVPPPTTPESDSQNSGVVLFLCLYRCFPYGRDFVF